MIIHRLQKTGKETAPKDLIGKSGKLEMTIKYTNHSKQIFFIDC